MKISPYLMFSGNCTEAIKFYEGAFGVKAEFCHYKDAPPAEGYQPPPGTEDFIMHGTLSICNDTIYLADTTPDHQTSFGNGVSICVEFDDADGVRAAFEGLKEGAKVLMEPQECFWSKCFCQLEAKFGVSWTIQVVMG